MAVVTRAAAAQTTFAWPTTPVDVTHYTWVDECLAAADRVEHRAMATLRPDTLPPTPPTAIPAVKEVAQQCSARFPAQTATLTDFSPLLALYLTAGRDADAHTLLARRLAAIAPAARRERAVVLDSAVGIFLTVRPVRFAAAESLLVERDRLGDTVLAFQQRHMGYVRLWQRAMEAQDTVVADWAAHRVVLLAAHLNAAERRTSYYDHYGKYYAYDALTYLGTEPLLDSLRHSTTAYVAMQRANWAKAAGKNAGRLELPIGEPAPAVHGDYWFGATDTTITRPTRGKVALVFVADNYVRALRSRLYCGADNCREAYAVLRRLARRFPSLEITLLAQTRGYFRQAAPPAPAEEASILRQYLLDYHHLPGTLAVERTDFWRLDPPDRRRVDRPTSNETRYSFGGSWPVHSLEAFLVDEKGTIVDVTHDVSIFGGEHPKGLERSDEVRLAALIEILLDRQQSAGR
jgi:hypothetical protein